MDYIPKEMIAKLDINNPMFAEDSLLWLKVGGYVGGMFHLVIGFYRCYYLSMFTVFAFVTDLCCLLSASCVKPRKGKIVNVNAILIQ